MKYRVEEIETDRIGQYARVPMKFEVASIFDIQEDAIIDQLLSIARAKEF